MLESIVTVLSKHISIPLKELLSLFRFYWPSFFSLVFMLVFLWLSDQGQDILVHYITTDINSGYFFLAALFFISTLALVFFNWYFPLVNLSKLESKLSLMEEINLKEQGYQPLALFIPKYFAVITVLICGLPLANVIEKILFPSAAGSMKTTSVLILGCILFYFGRSLFDNRIARWSKSGNDSKYVWYLYIIPLLFTVLPYFINLIDGTHYTKYYFASLLISPLAFSLFVYAFISRSHVSTEQVLYTSKIGEEEETGKSKLKNMYLPTSTRYIHFMALIIAFVYVMLFIISNLSDNFAIFLGPIVVAISAIITLIGIANLLKYYITLNSENKLVYRIGIFGILFICYSSCTDQKFPINTMSNGCDSCERMKIEEHTDKWLDQLDSKCPADSTIYLVAAYGGGIRAAYWTNLVLAQHMDKYETFYDQVYSVTGASGGMIGAGLFVSMGKTKSNYNKHTKEVKYFYNHRDFLSPIVARYFGLDFIKTFFGFAPFTNIEDRHHKLYNIFRDRLEEVDTTVIFDTSIEDYIKEGSELSPLLMSTTAWSQKGKIGLYSPVKLSEEMNNINIDLIDTLKVKDEEKYDGSRRSISIGQSIFESARFPAASPPGSMAEGFQFVDAGYVDNLGAGTTIDLLEILTDKMIEKSMINRFKIKVLIIDSGEKEASKFENYPPLVNNLISFLNLRSGRHEDLLRSIKQSANDISMSQFGEISISVSNENLILNNRYTYKNETRKNIYPLGWYLSQIAIDSICAQSYKLELDSADYFYTANVERNLESWGIDSSIVYVDYDSNCDRKEVNIVLKNTVKINYDKYDFKKSELEYLMQDINIEKFISASNESDYTSALRREKNIMIAELDSLFPQLDNSLLNDRKNLIKMTAYLINEDLKGNKISAETIGTADGQRSEYRKPILAAEYLWKDGKMPSNFNNKELAMYRAINQNYYLEKVMPKLIPTIEIKEAKGIEYLEKERPDLRSSKTIFKVSKVKR